MSEELSNNRLLEIANATHMLSERPVASLLAQELYDARTRIAELEADAEEYRSLLLARQDVKSFFSTEVAELKNRIAELEGRQGVVTEEMVVAAVAAGHRWYNAVTPEPESYEDAERQHMRAALVAALAVANSEFPPPNT